MKICRNCNKFIEDDALVCPYCGCVSRNNNIVRRDNTNENRPRKKSRIWLWILGWMCFFPIPLTVLVARSKKLNNILMLMEILVL